MPGSVPGAGYRGVGKTNKIKQGSQRRKERTSVQVISDRGGGHGQGETGWGDEEW